MFIQNQLLLKSEMDFNHFFRLWMVKITMECIRQGTPSEHIYKPKIQCSTTAYHFTTAANLEKLVVNIFLSKIFYVSISASDCREKLNRRIFLVNLVLARFNKLIFDTEAAIYCYSNQIKVFYKYLQRKAKQYIESKLRCRWVRIFRLYCFKTSGRRLNKGIKVGEQEF